jgi:hypothetical protein
VKRGNLIRLGGLAAMVGGVASAALGLLYVMQAQGVTYDGSIQNALRKGNYENPVLTILLIGVMAAIAALHAIQRRHYGTPGLLASVVAFAGVAMTVGANLMGELVPTLAPMAIILLIVGIPAALAGVIGLGIVTLNALVLPRWCGAALVIVGVLGLPAALSGRIGWALLGVPWAVVGYAVFRAGGRSTERPSRVR